MSPHRRWKADVALTMSLSPSFPQGAPTLAEVLLQRTFAKPPEPFVDGDLTQALSRADVEAPDAIKPAAKQEGAGTSTQDDPSDQSSAGGEPGKTIDVRV
jgi:hypothetical protein